MLLHLYCNQMCRRMRDLAIFDPNRAAKEGVFRPRKRVFLQFATLSAHSEIGQSHWLFEPLIVAAPLFPWFFGCRS